MSKPILMVGWSAELRDGRKKTGSVGVPSDDPQKACAAVAGMVRSAFKHELEDLDTVFLGPA